jgi:hypothetical protein
MRSFDLLRRRCAALVLAAGMPLGLASCDDDLRRQATRVKAELEPYFDHAEVGPTLLRSEAIYEGEALGIPQRILATPAHLVVSDRASEHRLHVFDRATGERLGSFGRDGRGPGEFTHAPEISTVPGQAEVLYAYDGNQRRVTRLRLPEMTPVDFGDRSVLTLPGEQTVYDLVMLDQDRAVGLGLFPAARLGFFNLVDNSAHHTGRLPSDDGYPFHIVQMAHIAFLAVHPMHERFAVLTRHGTRVELYDRGGDLVAEAAGPHPFRVDYEVDRRGDMLRGPRNRHAYRGAAAGEDRLYALFSGRAEAHFPGPSGQAAEFVHVLDWEGRLDRVYRLDREVYAIALGPTGTALYAVTHSPEPAVLRFPLE